MKQRSPVVELYASYFDEGRYPVRAFVGSGELLLGARFEITGIAYKKAGARL